MERIDKEYTEDTTLHPPRTLQMNNVLLWKMDGMKMVHKITSAMTFAVKLMEEDHD